MKLLTVALIAGIPLVTALLHAVPPPDARLAPTWTLKDVNGRDVRSDQFRGKVVVIDFWATWCGPCRVEIPGYIELQKKYGDRLAIVGVSVDQGPEIVKKFIAANRVDYPIVMADEAVQEAFGGAEGLNAIPTTFIIDPEGYLRERKVGAEATAKFEQRLLKYLR